VGNRAGFDGFSGARSRSLSAVACILKSGADEDLLEAVRATDDDRPFFTPHIKDVSYLGAIRATAQTAKS
jgi:hypothetical protein